MRRATKFDFVAKRNYIACKGEFMSVWVLAAKPKNCMV